MFYLKGYLKRYAENYLSINRPSFLIIGAQKSGTSSLFYYLNQHHNLVGSKIKEVRFFNRDDNYSKGYTWYHKSFKYFVPSDLFGRQLHFEATPEYLYREVAINRIQLYNPDIKLIIILREPVQRAYSAWNMYRSFTHEKQIPSILMSGYIEGKENNIFKELYSSNKFPSFEDCMKSELEKINLDSSLEEPSFIRRGIYHNQVQRVLDLFGSNQVLILGFKDLTHNKREVLNKTLAFLDLPNSSWNFLQEEVKNKRAYKDTIDLETKNFLEEFYYPHNQKLFEVIGTTLNW